MKPVNTEHVLRADTIMVNAGDHMRACDSETAHNSALFPSPVTWRCDGLAVSGAAVGWKRTSLWFGRLVWTRVTSSVRLTMLGE